jgi:hypothetical protein
LLSLAPPRATLLGLDCGDKKAVEELTKSNVARANAEICMILIKIVKPNERTYFGCQDVRGVEV